LGKRRKVPDESNNEMITKKELKELLSVFNYYMIGGLMLGITCATVTANSSIVFVTVDYGSPAYPKVITASIVILLGVMIGLSAYLILLPAELKLVRQKLKPILLAQRLSRKK
jgi:hypothetical protein